MKLYLGNLSYGVTEADLKAELSQFGQIESVAIIKDKFSGRSKGFGFVEMASRTEAQAAIDGLNGKEFKGRALKVNEARAQSQGRGGKGAPGGRGGYNRGRNDRGRPGRGR